VRKKRENKDKKGSGPDGKLGQEIKRSYKFLNDNCLLDIRVKRHPASPGPV